MHDTDHGDETVAFWLHAIELGIAALTLEWILFILSFLVAEFAGFPAVKAAKFSLLGQEPLGYLVSPGD
jgi:hypothetical protein